MSQHSRGNVCSFVVALWLGVMLPGGEVDAAQLCCEIKSIDKKTGVVAARNLKTKQIIRFEVDNAVLLNRIAIGQRAEVDLQSGKASIEGIQGRFRVVAASPVVAKRAKGDSTARPGEPCCGITHVNAERGVVTARETATGRRFTFTVTDASVLHGLRTGQSVHAHFATGQVSLDGLKPCCRIAGLAADTKSKPPISDTTLSPKGARTSRGGISRNAPTADDTDAEPEESDADAESAKDGTEEGASDDGSFFPAGTTAGGNPVDDNDYPPGASEQPMLDAGKSYSYAGGEAPPLQGEAPWWRQPLPQE